MQIYEYKLALLNLNKGLRHVLVQQGGHSHKLMPNLQARSFPSFFFAWPYPCLGFAQVVKFDHSCIKNWLSLWIYE